MYTVLSLHTPAFLGNLLNCSELRPVYGTKVEKERNIVWNLD